MVVGAKMILNCVRMIIFPGGRCDKMKSIITTLFFLSLSIFLTWQYYPKTTTIPTANIKLEPEQKLVKHELMKKYMPIEFDFYDEDVVWKVTDRNLMKKIGNINK